MATSDLHARAAALVADKLALRGEPVYLRRFLDSAPSDPDQEWRPGDPVPVDYSLTSLWTNYNVDAIDGELILEGDQVVTIGSLDLDDPVPNRDLLIRYPGEGDQQWSIVRSRAIRRGSTAVLFELQARRVSVQQ